MVLGAHAILPKYCVLIHTKTVWDAGWGFVGVYVFITVYMYLFCQRNRLHKLFLLLLFSVLNF